jgi:hypothetical protein
MKKNVKDFNGFKKIYENELNSESQSEVKTKPEEGKKAVEVINQSIKQDLKNTPIKSFLDNIESQSQKEIKESVIDPKKFTKFTSSSDPQSEAELKSKVEALSKDLNVTEEMQSLYATLKKIIEKNAPKHPTFGKLEYIDTTSVHSSNGILRYETAKGKDSRGDNTGNVRFEVTESERKHIENILSSSVAKQKTLKWLATTAQVLGGSMILLGIGMVMVGISNRSDLYSGWNDELNKKFGFLNTDSGADFSVPKYHDPVTSEFIGFAPAQEEIFDELKRKGMILRVQVGGDDSMDNFGIKEYGYIYSWDKILTSDQTAQLSSNTLTYLLGGAITSGVGALSLWAGMVLSDKNRIEEFLDYVCIVLKAACFTIGLPVEKLTNLGDISELLSRNFSMITRRPGYMH